MFRTEMEGLIIEVLGTSTPEVFEDAQHSQSTNSLSNSKAQ